MHVEVSSDDVIFSYDELDLFKRRYENGYDLTHDSRYNLWLEAFHPTSKGLE